VDADVATMTLLERLNDGGEVFLTHTTVAGRVVLRAAIGAPTTTRATVERLWALLCENHDWLATDFAEAAAQQARQDEAGEPATTEDLAPTP
jgi:aromatic-L-amino-acid decarboxylase